MRGDSRRDLYSKTLALCGLGVLAGAGALVDYWPVGVRFPVTASPAAASPAATTSTSASSDALSVLANLLETPRRAGAPSIDPNDLPVLVEAVDYYESLPTAAVSFDIGTAVNVHELPAPAFVNVRHEVPTLPGAPIVLMAPAIDSGLDDGFGRASTDNGGWFLTTAFRKTGTSIVRTGVKTGSSLVGAVRVVGNAVRRALPD